METLEQALEIVRQRIAQQRDYFAQSETAVRGQLLSPILKSLGWDTEDPDQVQLDAHMKGGGVPDYALLKDGGKVMIIEAKCLGADLNKHLPQLLSYCNSEHVCYGLLSNARHWMLYRSFLEGTHPNEWCIWRVDIIEEEPSEVARKLRTIARESIGQLEVLCERYRILDKLWENVWDAPERFAGALRLFFAEECAKQHPRLTFTEEEEEEIEDFLLDRARTLWEDVPPAEPLGPKKGPKPPKPKGKVPEQLVLF
jgi:hypothetical protein